MDYGAVYTSVLRKEKKSVLASTELFYSIQSISKLLLYTHIQVAIPSYIHCSTISIHCTNHTHLRHT